MTYRSRIGLTLYSGILLVVFMLLKLLSSLDRRIKRFVKDREISDERLREIKDDASRARTRVLFFCSSAGEYEQTKPVIDELSQNPRCYVLVLFFSESGIEFVKSKGEKINFLKSPVDAVWEWNKVFEAVLPDVTVIVRHEIWPAFVHVAKRFSKLVLINYSVGRVGTWCFFRRKLLEGFDEICAVSPKDASFLLAKLGFPSDKVVVTGDTKYDRALSRAERAQRNSQQLPAILTQWRRERRFIVGSAWHRDVELVLATFKSEIGTLSDWLVILVPHDVGTNTIHWIEDECRKNNLSFVTLSGLERSVDHRDAAEPDVLIVDKIGILAELYGLCHLAMVGGALHHRVHNVLEPASHGLPVCFGPLFETSSEAKELVESNLAAVIRTERDLSSWWISKREAKSKSSEMVRYVNERCGAAKKICSRLTRLTGKDDKE
ncbi:MAG: 3-deoxy-D-manno-octulosonic acid transferase [Oligoflexales bacterium]